MASRDTKVSICLLAMHARLRSGHCKRNFRSQLRKSHLLEKRRRPNTIHVSVHQCKKMNTRGYDAIRLLRQLRLLGPGGLACPIISSKVSTRCWPTSTQAIKKLDQRKSRMKLGRVLGLLKYAAKAISSIPR